MNRWIYEDNENREIGIDKMVSVPPGHDSELVVYLLTDDWVR
jgi:hypothetical protein